MPRKSKETTVEERRIIFKMRDDGKSLKEIAKCTQRSISTIHSILGRKKLENSCRPGRPTKMSYRDKANIIRQVKENPRVSAVEINKSLAEHSKINVSTETVLESWGMLGTMVELLVASRLLDPKMLKNAWNSQRSTLTMMNRFGTVFYSRTRPNLRYFAQIVEIKFGEKLTLSGILKTRDQQ